MSSNNAYKYEESVYFFANTPVQNSATTEQRAFASLVPLAGSPLHGSNAIDLYPFDLIVNKLSAIKGVKEIYAKSNLIKSDIYIVADTSVDSVVEEIAKAESELLDCFLQSYPNIEQTPKFTFTILPVTSASVAIDVKNYPRVYPTYARTSRPPTTSATK